ncbi:MAG: hypothetical protein JXR48_10905 [Candidatus Delongbacteria bacterium]|nr:hypothetical protein [Candidatus Delongbacteria bacterium]MBN2835461.1 hypothetical protein [Candidatus Delongbacteria bacterium]
MLNTKLILVEGIPGTGKSTMAQFIAIQLEKNGKKVKWYHECQDDHFFWNETDSCFENNEYFFRDQIKIDTFMSLNLKLWEKLVYQALSDDVVYIFDGYLFAQLANTLYRSDMPTDKIVEYMQQVEKIITKLNPLLVFYTVNNPEFHTIRTWNDRAQWAKDLVIKNSENVPFVKRSIFKGEDAIGYEQNLIQEANTEIFDSLQINKIRLDISDKDYKNAHKKILEKLSLDYKEYRYSENNLEQFCGLYRYNSDDIFIKILSGKLVCDWGQNNMALIPIGENLLNLRSYPVYLKFLSKENGFFKEINTYGEPVFRRIGCKFRREEG